MKTWYIYTSGRGKLNVLVNIRSCCIVVVLLFYVHGKHLRSCRDGDLYFTLH